MVAGNETTRNGISQGMLALFEHPEQRRRLTAEPAHWATVPDEILRWTSPVRAMRRVALRETTLRDRTIQKGQSVVMIYASANRDETKFANPDVFDIDRKTKPSFGWVRPADVHRAVRSQAHRIWWVLGVG